MSANGETMQAIVIERFGGPDVMELRTVPRPVPAADEVIVEVRAVTVNQTLDIHVRRNGDGRDPSLPLVLGSDPVGVVVAAGAALDAALLGAHVAVRATLRCGHCARCIAHEPRSCTQPRRLGVTAWGGYADYVAVPESSLVIIPSELAFPDAAVIFRHVPTAFQLLDGKANIAAGESVLVMGASGGLGNAGIQVAKLRGARAIAAAGTEPGLALARELGADETINYRREDLETRVLELTGDRGVDIVFENVGAAGLFEAAFRALAPGGRLVTAGAHAGGEVRIDVKRLYRKKLSLLGGSGAAAADIQATIDGVARGAFRAGIARIVPLSEVWEAHRLVEERLVTGKVVMVPDRVFANA